MHNPQTQTMVWWRLEGRGGGGWVEVTKGEGKMRTSLTVSTVKKNQTNKQKNWVTSQSGNRISLTLAIHNCWVFSPTSKFLPIPWGVSPVFIAKASQLHRVPPFSSLLCCLMSPLRPPVPLCYPCHSYWWELCHICLALTTSHRCLSESAPPSYFFINIGLLLKFQTWKNKE